MPTAPLRVHAAAEAGGPSSKTIFPWLRRTSSSGWGWVASVSGPVASGGVVFHGLAAENDRMLLELVAHLIGDEDVQSNPRA